MLAVFTVTNLDDSGPGSLREAIDVANVLSGPDEIEFSVTGTIDLNSQLTITDGLVISGPGQDQLRLDAGHGSDNLPRSADGFRIFNIDDGTTGYIEVEISGLTLTGGDTAEGVSGGAIRSSEHLTMIASTITSNAAGRGRRGSSGGGDGGSGGRGGAGGGIFSPAGNLMVIESTISNNNSGSGGRGGDGYYVIGGGGGAGGPGGDGGPGGGIFNSLGDLTIIGSTVSGNSAGSGGSGGSGEYGQGPNGFSGRGGGTYSADSLTVSDGTVSGNTAVYAGGIFSRGAATITHSTVTKNRALFSSSAGGIETFDGLISITNSIVADNELGDIDPGDDGSLDVNFSLIGQIGLPIVGIGNILGLPAHLGSLAHNGGATQTHGLLPDSPAIDAGDPNIGFNPAEFDQRGAPFVRVFDGDGVGGTRIDMGAHERQTVPGLNLIVDTALDENDGDFSAGNLSLREAVIWANASAGADTITFDPSVFAAQQTIVLELGEIELAEEVTINGPGQSLLTLDAQLQSRIFNFTDTAGELTVAGLTMTGGRSLIGGGGAIRSSTTGTLTVEQSAIVGNIAYGSSGGGGIYAAGNVSMVGSAVNGNSTIGNSAAGGGIRAGDVVTLIGSTVNGNNTSGRNAAGGGIMVDGDVILTDSTVHGNSTSGDSSAGGGISLTGNMVLTDSRVTANSTAGNHSFGGGIMATAFGDFVITNSTVSENGTRGINSYGGGIWARADLALTSSTVSNNWTAGDGSGGGGIWAGRNVLMTSSTVSGNHTSGDFSDGGGLYNRGPTTIIHSTVFDNHTRGTNSDGGGIATEIEFYDPLLIHNSIVAGNSTVSGVSDLESGAAPLSVNFSLIGTSVMPDAGTSGNNVVTDDPQLGALADNGGRTKTHTLLPGSPAIDAGDPNIVFNPSEFDQRDAPFVRVFDGDGVGGARIDIGAQERQTLVGLNLVVDTWEDEQDLDYSAGDLSLREAVGLAGGSVGTDTITFEDSVFALPQTISLTLGEMVIDEAVEIQGPGQHLLTIDARQESRIFNIAGTTGDFAISAMSVTGGATTSDLLAGQGGAIRARTDGTVTLDRVTITNSSTTGLGAHGGGIFSAGQLTLTNSTVTENWTTGQSAAGGGIASYGDVALIDSTISENSTSADGAVGGGVFAFGSSTTINVTNSTVSGNITSGAGSRGGGLITGGPVMLMNSTVSGNRTSGDGADGGGIQSSGDVSVVSSTITGNQATHYNATGGGIWNLNDTITVTNSIVAGNGASGGEVDIEPGTGALTINFSLIGTDVMPDAGTSGNNVLTNEPMLGPLADNGGPTLTHALLLGSPAIEAGDPGFAGPPDFDQRGAPFVRVVDGDGDAVARIDIGAIEFQQANTLICDFDDDGDCDIDDIDALMLEIGAGTNNQLFDLTGDGLVNLSDRDAWLLEAGTSTSPFGTPFLAADSNLDGTVDAQDFLVWNANKFTSTGSWSQADWNGDGNTDEQDFHIWNANKFQSSGSDAQPVGILSTPFAVRVVNDGFVSTKHHWLDQREFVLSMVFGNEGNTRYEA